MMLSGELLEIIGPAMAAGLMIALTHAPLGIEVLRRGIEMCAKRGRWLNRLRPIGVAGADVALSRGDGRHRRDAHGSSRCRKRPMRDSAISASSVRHRLACLWSERVSSSQAPAPSAG